MALLRTAQNASCHVNSLPAELLLKILGPLRLPRGQDSIRYWLTVLQVCRRWRSVLLFHSTPWTIINTYSRHTVDSLQYFLAKSGSHPIEVYIVSFDPLYAVAQESHRLNAMGVFSANRWNDREFRMLATLCKPAPLLETFECVVLEPYGTEPELPLLFAAQTPRLHKVGLYHIPSLGNNRFGSLTHLSVRGREDVDSRSLRFHEIVDVLRQNPALEELCLSYIDPWIGSADDPGTFAVPTSNFDLVHMVHIRQMMFTECTIGQLTILFRFLHLPEDSVLEVSALRGCVFGIPEYTLFSNTALLRNLICIQSLTIKGKVHASGIGPSGSFLLDSLDTDITSIYQLDLLPFAGQIQELWIEDETDPNHCWYSFFLSLPRLQKLYLCDGHSRHILSALARTTFPPHHIQPQLPCENLTSLWIGGDPLMPEQPSSSYYDLLQCLELRHSKGHPIHDVHVRPHVDVAANAWSPVLLQEMERFVDTVEFNTERLPVMKLPRWFTVDMRWNAESYHVSISYCTFPTLVLTCEQ